MFSSSRVSRRSASRAAIATMGAALLLGLTACALSGDADAELKTGDFETSIVDWRDQMDSCMLDAGFDMTPTGGDGETIGSVDTSQFDMAEFDKAYAQCSKEVGEPPVDESLPSEAELFESQLIFAQCMREAGYDYPDPVKGSGGMSPAFGSDVDPAVVDACGAQANESAAQ